MNVISDIYKVYLTVKDEDILLPQTPASITISNADNTIEEKLVNGRPFTIAQLDGAQTFKFEFSITKEAYPFTFKDALKGIRYYTDLVWQIKEDREPIGLTIIRTHGQPSTCVTVLLQDYSYIEDYDDLNDYTFSVTFVEYHPQKNQELPYSPSSERHHLLVAGEATGWSAEIKGAVQQAVGTATAEDLERAEHLASRRKEWESLQNGTTT